MKVMHQNYSNLDIDVQPEGSTLLTAKSGVPFLRVVAQVIQYRNEHPKENLLFWHTVPEGASQNGNNNNTVQVAVSADDTVQTLTDKVSKDRSGFTGLIC